MRAKGIAAAMLTSCAVIAMFTVPGVVAQTPQQHKHQAATTTTPKPGMTAKCQAMMADHDTMMAEMKTADQRLDNLVATMNAATGTTKADAVAAVVNELVAQRKTMREGMMKGQQAMMGHMKDHMQAGKDSMADCPMMK